MILMSWLLLPLVSCIRRYINLSIPAEEIDGWTVDEFLSNSGVMRDGQLTRAAILLLGKPLSLQKIHPAVAQITWTWEDKDETVIDYEHFTIPFILTVDKVLAKIRNKNHA